MTIYSSWKRNGVAVLGAMIALSSIALAAKTDWSAGKGYRTLPASGCPSAPIFGHEHFKQLALMAGCQAPASEIHSKRIYRGGAPTEAGYGCLKQLGLSAVFDLRTEGEIKGAKAAAESQGLLYYSYPMATGSSAASASCKSNHLSAAQCNRKNVLAALDQLERLFQIDPQASVFVHCARGEDRTGLVIGLYRALKERCPKAAALSEMKEYYYTAYDPLKEVWSELTANSP